MSKPKVVHAFLCDEVKSLADGGYLIQDPLMSKIGILKFPFIIDRLSCYVEIDTGGKQVEEVDVRVVSLKDKSVLSERGVTVSLADWKLPGSLAIRLPSTSFEGPGVYALEVRLGTKGDWSEASRVEFVQASSEDMAIEMDPSLREEFTQHMKKSAEEFFATHK